MDACTVMKREKRHNASGISNEGMQFLAMRQDVWSRAAKDGGLQLVQWSGQTLVGVNGSPLQTHGQGLLQFTLQDNTFEASVIVTSDLKVEVIIGVDFCRNTAA